MGRGIPPFFSKLVLSPRTVFMLESLQGDSWPEVLTSTSGGQVWRIHLLLRLSRLLSHGSLVIPWGCGITAT